MLKIGIRWLLMALLMWGVYGEAGPATVARFCLIFLASEMNAVVQTRHVALSREAVERLLRREATEESLN